MPVPVTRTEGYCKLRPNLIHVTRVPTGTDDNFEMSLQTLTTRELSRRVGVSVDGSLMSVADDARLEIWEHAMVELTRDQLRRLQGELARALKRPRGGGAARSARPRPVDDRAALADFIYGDSSRVFVRTAAAAVLVAAACAAGAAYLAGSAAAPEHAAAQGSRVSVVAQTQADPVPVLAEPRSAPSRPDVEPPALRAASGPWEAPAVPLLALAAQAPDPVAPERVEDPPQRMTEPTAAALQQAAAAPPRPPADEPQSARRTVVRTHADAWIEVRDPKGEPVLARLMHAGDEWTPPPRPGLRLTTGNAGATELLVGGTGVPRLGPPGAVRRDVPLDVRELW